MTTRPSVDPATSLIHHAYTPPGGFCAVQPGVFKASTVIFQNTAALRARNWKEKHIWLGPSIKSHFSTMPITPNRVG